MAICNWHLKALTHLHNNLVISSCKGFLSTEISCLFVSIVFYFLYCLKNR